MNIFEFYTNYPNAHLKTAAGHDVTITNVNPSNPYPLEGFAMCPTAFKYDLVWDVNGYPAKLPLTHGMNLLPYLPETTYKQVNLTDLTV